MEVDHKHDHMQSSMAKMTLGKYLAEQGCCEVLMFPSWPANLRQDLSICHNIVETKELAPPPKTILMDPSSGAT